MNSLYPRALGSVFLVLLSISGICQETAKNNKEKKSLLTVAVQPLFLPNRIAKLDIESKMPRSNFSYVLSPELFFGTVYDKRFFSGKDLPGDKLRGFGLDLKQKLSSPRKDGLSVYVGYGITYRYNSISFEDEGYLPYQENNLEYYEYRRFTDKLRVNSLIISAITGFQTIDRGNFLIEMYGGPGYKFSSKSSTYPNQRNYTQSYISYAYEGFLMHFGVKLGFKVL